MALSDGYSINCEETDLPDCEETDLLLNNDMEPAVKELCSARYSLALLMFFGFAVAYGLRVNLSVAMVAMVNGTESHQSLNRSTGHECPAHSDNHNSSKNTNGPRYPWSPETQGMLLGAFFFGYLVTQIPGGYLTGCFGVRIFLGGGVLGTAALTLLTPLAAQLGISWVFALHALEGFGEVREHFILTASGRRSYPEVEKKLYCISSKSHYVIWRVTFLLSYTNYCFSSCPGGTGCLWAVFGFVLVSNEPRTHPRISEPEEKLHYQLHCPHGWSIPLVSMMFSVPLWAIIICQMCSNWSNYTLLTSLPTYMDTVLRFDLQQVTSVLWVFLQTSVCSRWSSFGKHLNDPNYQPQLPQLQLSTTIRGTSKAGVFINQIDIAPLYLSMFDVLPFSALFTPNLVTFFPLSSYAGFLLGITLLGQFLVYFLPLLWATWLKM
uniref:Si:ch1073-513e17.1 n=1 Tax=Denticeps clupeoides TaxID=299321 RepID=A0AAY4CF15_9TELE